MLLLFLVRFSSYTLIHSRSLARSYAYRWKHQYNNTHPYIYTLSHRTDSVRPLSKKISLAVDVDNNLANIQLRKLNTNIWTHFNENVWNQWSVWITITTTSLKTATASPFMMMMMTTAAATTSTMTTTICLSFSLSDPRATVYLCRGATLLASPHT